MNSKRMLRYLLILTLGLSLFVCSEYLGFFEGIDNCAYDLSFRIRGQRRPPDTIIVAAIDEKSLGKMGRWPINREYYAKVLDITGQARVVGLEIIMAEPSDSDLLLRDAIIRHGRVVMAAYIDSRGHVDVPASSFPQVKFGHVHIEQDIDGVARKVFHTLRVKSSVMPSFASVIWEMLAGRPWSEGIPPARPVAMQRGDIVQDSLMKINYYGPPRTFQHVSLSDIIDGAYAEDFFRDKIVLVGLSAVGVEGGILTPFAQQRDRMAGVEVQANILGNLLAHNYIRDTDRSIRWLLSLTLSFIVGLLLLHIKPRGTKPLIWWVLGMLALMVASIGLFTYGNRWLSPCLPGFSLTLTFALAYIFRVEEIGDQLLESRDNWEYTFDAIDDAIVLLDKECSIIQMNRAAQQSYDPVFLKTFCRKFFTRNEHAVSTPRGTPPEAGAVTEELFDHTLNKHLEIRSLPRLGKRNNLEGEVLIIRDISDRKRAEEEQQKTLSQLFQSQKMEAVGHLAGGIAHDFNNLLTTIMGSASLLALEIDKDSKARPYVDEIISSAEMSANLTRQLLAFSRKQTFALRETALNELVRGMERFLKRIIGEDIELQVRCSREDITVMVDPGQIEQVLMNLATNSRDAMPHGGLLSIGTGTVALDEEHGRLHGLEKPGEYAVMTLSDSGTGMDEETRQKIFEPFFTTKDLGKGTGLGLSIVYGIIKQHRGNIMVYSVPGVGTTFKIYLPLAPSASGERRAAGAAVPKGRGETILIAEDHADVRNLVRKVLEASGYNVIEAKDGEDVITVFSAHCDEIRLVILDVIMPKKSGKEAGDAIRKIRPEVAILFTSGYTADVISRKGILEKDIDFIPKPMTPSDLLAKVREMLDKHAQ